jgi:MFS family permease
VRHVRRATSETFRALAVRNYRLFFAGQIVSVSGTWMQQVAQAWLVLQLTGSGVALGLVLAAQFLPMLVLGPWAGVVADRNEKRRVLFITQAAAASAALALGLLTLTGTVQLWMVFVLALWLGVANAFDMPTRQAFVFEMVGPDHLSNAISLNSIVMNAGRLVGPAVGGVLIATVGLATCFLLNAASYGATIAALALMRKKELHAVEPATRGRGQLLEGLRYVWSTPALRTPLLLIAIVGTLTYEFPVSLPLLSTFEFEAGAEGYGIMLSAMSVGAVAGGLAVATRMAPSHRRLGWAGVLFGVSVLMASAMPTFGATVAVLPVVGAISIAFITQANSTLQLTAAPAMRARVIALYGVAFLGSTPIGGPIIGWVAETAGPRAGLALGGAAALVASLLAWRSLNESSVSSPADRPTLHHRPHQEVAAGAPHPQVEEAEERSRSAAPSTTSRLRAQGEAGSRPAAEAASRHPVEEASRLGEVGGPTAGRHRARAPATRAPGARRARGRRAAAGPRSTAPSDRGT